MLKNTSVHENRINNNLQIFFIYLLFVFNMIPCLVVLAQVDMVDGLINKTLLITDHGICHLTASGKFCMGQIHDLENSGIK